MIFVSYSKKDNDMLCSVIPHLNMMLGDAAQNVAVIKKVILCSMQLYKVALKVSLLCTSDLFMALCVYELFIPSNSLGYLDCRNCRQSLLNH